MEERQPPPVRTPTDVLVLRVEVATPGLESVLTRRFRRGATVREAACQCRAALAPAVHGCGFHLTTRSGCVLPPDQTLRACGLTPMQELLLVPDADAAVARALREASADPAPAPPASVSATPLPPRVPSPAQPQEHQQGAGNSDSSVVGMQAVKSGHLVVGSSAGGARRRRWWCLLKYGRLYLFAGARDLKASECVDVAHARVVPLAPAALPLSPAASPRLLRHARERPFAELVPADGRDALVLCAECDDDEAAWTRALLSASSSRSSGEHDRTAGAAGAAQGSCDGDDSNATIEALVPRAAVASYVVRKVAGASGRQRRFAALVGTTLAFAESPADRAPAQRVALFSRKVVYRRARRRIDVAALGEVGFALTLANDADFLEWVRALRAALPGFVADGDELCAVDASRGVVRAGWLVKKKVTRRFSGAKRRWFVLKAARLYYLRSPGDPAALGAFDLLHTKATLLASAAATGGSQDAAEAPGSSASSSSSSACSWGGGDSSSSSSSVACECGGGGGSSSGGSGCADVQIELETPDAVYVLRAASAGELREWFECIQANSVGSPFNVVHKQHVDTDYNWCVGDPLELFDFEEKLGVGAYAAVYRARQRDTGLDVAIKLLRLEEDTAAALRREIDVLKRCRSAQVVSYYGTCSLPGQLWVLTELCRCGSLRDIMRRTLETLNEAQLAFVAAETLKGLCYLHARGIVHHDIKAGNILLTEDGQPKLADFGVAQQLRSADQVVVAHTYIGSPLYMSPEVLRRGAYTAKTDVWSLGITVIELAEGAPPNADIRSFDALLAAHERAPPRLSATAATWPPTLHDFVARCLVVNPDTRDRPVDLLAHPFLAVRRTTAVMMPLVAQCLRLRDAAAAAASAPSSPVVPEVVDPATGTCISAAALAEQLRAQPPRAPTTVITVRPPPPPPPPKPPHPPHRHLTGPSPRSSFRSHDTPPLTPPPPPPPQNGCAENEMKQRETGQ